MALKTLDSLAAFSPGCDLWIVADAQASRWARKIDWHLNFQIRRAGLHRAPALSSELTRVIEECEAEIPAFAVAPSAAPLMIASSSLLPNSKTVYVPADTQWVTNCHKIWNDLGRPPSRIFLPENLTPEEFSRAWPIQDADTDGIEVVAQV